MDISPSSINFLASSFPVYARTCIQHSAYHLILKSPNIGLINIEIFPLMLTLGVSPSTPKYSETGFPTSSLSNSTYTQMSCKQVNKTFLRERERERANERFWLTDKIKHWVACIKITQTFDVRLSRRVSMREIQSEREQKQHINVNTWRNW